ncbi:MAG: hypothetical protein V7693_16170 [Halopseudomonas sabulinigri]
MTNDSNNNDQLARVNNRLRNMGSAIDSNAISGYAVESEEGKAIMAHMLTSIAADDFDPAETRKMITDRLSAAKN